MSEEKQNQDEDPLAGPYFMLPPDENILTLDAVPAVDLSIAFSPVIPHQWDKRPVEAQKTVGGEKYLLRYGYGQNLRGEQTNTMVAETVFEDELRVMRARYLIRVKYLGLYFDCLPLAYYEREQILHDYFQGGLWQPPQPLLGKLRRGWRLHLEAVKSAPSPDKNTVEGQIVEHLKMLRSQEKGTS